MERRQKGENEGCKRTGRRRGEGETKVERGAENEGETGGRGRKQKKRGHSLSSNFTIKHIFRCILAEIFLKSPPVTYGTISQALSSVHHQC